MYSLTVMRHGQTTSYQEKRFSGWSNTPLTDVGRTEAVSAGQALKHAGYACDVCFTSCLIRAQDTAKAILNALELPRDIMQSHWRLNERHYGALQDEFRKDMAQKHSVADVVKWRNTYDAYPPELTEDDPRWREQIERLDMLPPDQHPRSESMRQAVARTQRFWHSNIVPALKAHQNVLVVAHTSTLRSLVGGLEGFTDTQAAGFRISTATPRHYILDEGLTPIQSYDVTSNSKVKMREWVIRNKIKLLKNAKSK